MSTVKPAGEEKCKSRAIISPLAKLNSLQDVVFPYSTSPFTSLPFFEIYKPFICLKSAPCLYLISKQSFPEPGSLVAMEAKN